MLAAALPYLSLRLKREGQMWKFQILCLFGFQSICGSSSLEEYFSYISQLNQPRGNYREGEIEIVIDPVEISQIQKTQENRLLRKGFSTDQATEFSQIGIVNEDPYWIWLRDAVYFPQKIPGTYDRLLLKSEVKSKCPGVAVLPVSSTEKIILILIYRHANRSWEFELPRGEIESQETLEESAFRELKEETGFIASSMNFLGEISIDSGVRSSVIPVFLGKISARQESNPEYSEGIDGTYAFTKNELKEGLIKGFLEVKVKGTKRQVPLRDAFLTFALLQAEYRKLL